MAKYVEADGKNYDNVNAVTATLTYLLIASAEFAYILLMMREVGVMVSLLPAIWWNMKNFQARSVREGGYSPLESSTIKRYAP